MKPALAGLMLLCLTAGGCGGGTASLRYAYPPGRVTTYRWTVDATTTPSRAPGRTLRLEAVVRERVVGRVGAGGGRLEAVLEPGEAVQDGRHVNPGPGLTLDLDVGPDGHVTRVGATSSLPAGAMGSLGLDRLLAESRPPLPARGVRLRDRWNADVATPVPDAPAASGAGGSTIDLSGTGRLERFLLRDGRRIAAMTIERRGRVALRPDGPSATGTATGTATDTTAAEFDLDRGLVIDATSKALTNVTFASGPVQVELTSRMTLQG
jgi:hypothetical protein